jgi:hypothetical protein
MHAPSGRHRRYELVVLSHGAWLTLQIDATSERLARAAASLELPGADVVRIREVVAESSPNEVMS